jgi:hypothetical protein
MTRTYLALVILSALLCATVSADVADTRDSVPYLPKVSVFSTSAEQADFAAKDNHRDFDVTVAGNCLEANTTVEMFSICDLNVGRSGIGSPFMLASAKPDFKKLDLIEQTQDSRVQESSTLSIQIIEELARNMDSIDDPGSNAYRKKSKRALATINGERHIMEAPVFSEVGLWLVLTLAAVVLPMAYFHHSRRLFRKFAI